jgi:hypothetical protein
VCNSITVPSKPIRLVVSYYKKNRSGAKFLWSECIGRCKLPRIDNNRTEFYFNNRTMTISIIVSRTRDPFFDFSFGITIEFGGGKSSPTTTKFCLREKRGEEQESKENTTTTTIICTYTVTLNRGLSSPTFMFCACFQIRVHKNEYQLGLYGRRPAAV